MKGDVGRMEGHTRPDSGVIIGSMHGTLSAVGAARAGDIYVGRVGSGLEGSACRRED